MKLVVLEGGEVWREELTITGQKGALWGDGYVFQWCSYIRYTFVKVHQTVYRKRVNISKSYILKT